jgi:Tfp pilus assembly major pilin PilA
MKKRDGFTVVEVVMVVVGVVIIVGVGWLAYSNVLAPKASDLNTSDATPVEVENKSDLDKVNTTLDQLSLDDSDSNDLDKAVNSF